VSDFDTLNGRIMMIMTDDRKLETETTIRWDLLNPLATMFTADIDVKREWVSLGYTVTQPMTGHRGWLCDVPIDRINFKPLRKRTMVSASQEAVKVE
jgi:hypothetical protein